MKTGESDIAILAVLYAEPGYQVDHGALTDQDGAAVDIEHFA